MKAPSFTPDLFERLMDAHAQGGNAQADPRLSLNALKAGVARDLEALLNTRAVFPQEQLDRFQQCSKSILNYGLLDFSGLSLSNQDDCLAICRSLEQAITRHEPRLRNISATLDVQAGTINRLNFKLSAVLALYPAQKFETAQEHVSFDVLLQASSQHYSIRQARRVQAART